MGSWEGQQPSVDSHYDRRGSGRERERGMRPLACPRLRGLHAPRQPSGSVCSAGVHPPGQPQQALRQRAPAAHVFPGKWQELSVFTGMGDPTGSQGGARATWKAGGVATISELPCKILRTYCPHLLCHWSPSVSPTLVFAPPVQRRLAVHEQGADGLESV